MWKWNTAIKMDGNTGKVTIPAGMCEIVGNANVGYGPDDIVPCGAKATHTVTFKVYVPESDTWAEFTENNCNNHKLEAEAAPSDIVQIVSIEPYSGEYDGYEEVHNHNDYAVRVGTSLAWQCDTCKRIEPCWDETDN